MELVKEPAPTQASQLESYTRCRSNTHALQRSSSFGPRRHNGVTVPEQLVHALGLSSFTSPTAPVKAGGRVAPGFLYLRFSPLGFLAGR